MNLAIRIANQPCLVCVSIQPVDLQTSAIFLAAPAAAALYVEDVHVEATALRRPYILGSSSTFFEKVIVDGVYTPKRFCGYVRVGNADAKCFFHAHYELECVDRIQSESIRTEKWQIITDLLRSNLQHQVFDQHFLNSGAQIRLRHQRARILP